MFGILQQDKRVLLIHSDDEELEYLRNVLEPEFTVTTARASREALDHLGSGDYDVVITDAQFPDMSGEDVLRRSQNQQPAASRILLIDELDRDRLIHYMYESHVDACLQKPVDPNILTSAVHSASRSSRSTTSARSSVAARLCAGLLYLTRSTAVARILRL